MNPFGVVLGNPAAWIGLLALFAPLLIHLLTRRTPRTLVFPTIRFIRRAQSNLSSLFRVRHWILLLLRTLLVLLVLLAFLRPAWRGAAVAGGDPAAKQRAVLIVIDGSLSMGVSRGGGGPLARARQAAQKIVDSLGAADRCNLIVAAGLPHATFDEPSNNRFQLRSDLQSLKASLERANVDGAIGEALRQLAPLSGVRKEIHFISDFQRSNWEGTQLGRIPDGIVTTFVAVADEHPQNCAVTEVRVTPGDPVIDEPVAVVCKVANYGSEPNRLPLTLRVGEDAPLERTLDLKPGAIASTTFRIRSHKAGFYEGTLQIPPDDLAADNSRQFVLQVADKIQALVLTDESPDDPEAPHLFLCRALDPFAGGRGGTMRCTVRKPDALTPFDLERAHLVYLCGLRELAPAKARLLLEWLGQGGSLIDFLGGGADKANLDALGALSNHELTLPFDLRGQVDHRTGSREDFASFSGVNYDDPMLRTFRELSELGDVRFRRLYLTARTGGEGQVLMSFSDGNVALARTGYRLGSLLLCNFTPSATDSDLIKRTLFVPLVHELSQGMRPQGGAWRSFMVGSPATATVEVKSSDPAPTLLSPAGEMLNAVIEKGAGEVLVFYPRVMECGFYHVALGARTVAALPVNVDARESNLEALSPAQLKALAGASRRQFLAARAGDAGALDVLMEGRLLWPWLLLAGLLVLAVEHAATFFWRR